MLTYWWRNQVVDFAIAKMWEKHLGLHLYLRFHTGTVFSFCLCKSSTWFLLSRTSTPNEAFQTINELKRLMRYPRVCSIAWVAWYLGYEGGWVVWVRGLCGSKFYVGCVGYVGQNVFYAGQHFTWVIIFLRGSLRGSQFFAWV